LRLAIDVFGADRIMLGTDYPVLRPNPVLDTVAAADIDATQRELILHGSASALVSRLA
jgi:predicted TIM-barrel fold metal-dependent hydrolase